MASITDAMNDRLDEYARLEPDWDSYGADPIDSRAVEITRELIATVGVAPDYAFPLASSGIQLEWRADPRHLEVEVSADEGFDYLACPTDDFETWREGHINSLVEIVGFINDWNSVGG